MVFQPENLLCSKSILLVADVAFLSLKMQQVYQEASSQGAEGLLIERLKVQFENKIIKQLAMKVSCSIN